MQGWGSQGGTVLFGVRPPQIIIWETFADTLLRFKIGFTASDVSSDNILQTRFLDFK